MRLDAEKHGPALYAGGKDGRLTRIGKFLREHHLDELPQLWNVFCGDMAFIGPRPERQFFIDQIMKEDPRYRFLYRYFREDGAPSALRSVLFGTSFLGI